VVRWFTFNNIFWCTWSKFDYNGLTFFNIKKLYKNPIKIKNNLIYVEAAQVLQCIYRVCWIGLCALCFYIALVEYLPYENLEKMKIDPRKNQPNLDIKLKKQSTHFKSSPYFWLLTGIKYSNMGIYFIYLFIYSWGDSAAPHNFNV
jgi:hypothetical protein